MAFRFDCRALLSQAKRHGKAHSTIEWNHQPGPALGLHYTPLLITLAC